MPMRTVTHVAAYVDTRRKDRQDFYLRDEHIHSCIWIAAISTGSPDAPGNQPTMSVAEPAQNKTVTTVAMSKRKG